MSAAPKSISPADLSLLLLACRGATAYLFYLVRQGDATDTAAEVDAELRALDDALTIASMSPPNAARLLHDWPSQAEDMLLVKAEAYTEADWGLLDRRRSELSRAGVAVFLTTAPSFDVLMRVAPNLASWLGGLVFSHEDSRQRDVERREQRLAALRAWSDETDEEVIRAALEGTLSREPEYAEWLVLLGRGDLLDAS